MVNTNWSDDSSRKTPQPEMKVVSKSEPAGEEVYKIENKLISFDELREI